MCPISPDRFNEATTAYLEGRWEEACKGLDWCLHEVPDDGPSKVLLQVMTSKGTPVDRSGETKEEGLETIENGTSTTPPVSAPESWPGYRQLTEK